MATGACSADGQAALADASTVVEKQARRVKKTSECSAADASTVGEKQDKKIGGCRSDDKAAIIISLAYQLLQDARAAARGKKTGACSSDDQAALAGASVVGDNDQAALADTATVGEKRRRLDSSDVMFF